MTVDRAVLERKAAELQAMIAAGFLHKARELAEVIAHLAGTSDDPLAGCRMTAAELWADDEIPPERKFTGRLIDEDGMPGIGILPAGEVGILAGSAGGGKSMVAMGLAVGVAFGVPALGVVDVRRGRVLYVSTEDDGQELRRRLETYARRSIGFRGSMSFDEVREALGRIDLLVRPKGADWSLVDAAGRETAIMAAIRSTVAAGEYALVILDTLSRLGNDELEKSPTASRRFVEALELLAASPGEPTILVIHHARKAESSGRKKGDEPDDLTADSIRGTSGLVGGVRFALTLQPKEATVRLAQVKANYAPNTSVELHKGGGGVIWGRAK